MLAVKTSNGDSWAYFDLQLVAIYDTSGMFSFLISLFLKSFHLFVIYFTHTRTAQSPRSTIETEEIKVVPQVEQELAKATREVPRYEPSLGIFYSSSYPSSSFVSYIPTRNQRRHRPHNFNRSRKQLEILQQQEQCSMCSLLSPFLFVLSSLLFLFVSYSTHSPPLHGSK